MTASIKRIAVVLPALTFLVTLSGTAGTQENRKLAQTGFQFMSVVSDARASAMAEAMTSLQAGSSSLFFNPSGMADLSGTTEAAASNNRWIADITHNAFSMAVSPSKGNYGVIGFSVQSVDYGEFNGTRVDKSTDLGYAETGVFRLNALAVGAGYAKRLTDRFSVGGQVCWVRQNLGKSVIPVIVNQDTSTRTVESELTPLAFAFGTQFKTGFKSLVFGMSVRNFSKEIKYVEEGFQLPLVFNLGISMNALDFLESVPLKQTLIVALDASHYRDHPEQIKVGLEYGLLNALWLRGGYISSNDESGLSFGVGMQYSGVALDYAVTPFGVFDKVQRMTIRFGM